MYGTYTTTLPVCRPCERARGKGLVSMYARESLPPNKDARSLGLLNATSACSCLVRKGIYLSIHLLGVLRGQREAAAVRRKKVDTDASVGGW